MKPRRCTLPGARVENSPKFADRMRDISSWREGDIRSLSKRAEKEYDRRKSAIEDYLTSHISIDEINLRKHISSERLLQLAKQCLMQAEDGSPWGFRALMPGVNVIDYAAQPTAAGAAPSPEIPGEDTQNLNRETKSDSSYDTENPPAPVAAAPASLYEDEEIEDKDYDTAKRLAIKRAQQDADTLETPPTPVLQVEGKEPVETAAELDVPTVKLEPLSGNEEEQVEVAAELDESTIKLEPLSRDEEGAPQEPEQSLNIEEEDSPALEKPPSKEEEYLEAEQATLSEEAALGANQTIPGDVEESRDAEHTAAGQDEDEATIEPVQIPLEDDETLAETASSADSADDEHVRVPTDA